MKIAHLAWCNPKLARQNTVAAGDGLFAVEFVKAGERLVTWGGVIVTTEQLAQLPIRAQHHSVQVEEDLHLSSGLIEDPADYVNHSCNPNAGLNGQITLVALRDIQPNEEICFDYATSDSNPNFRMECACGQTECRHLVTGDDWKRPDLQQRYKGHFSPYIQRWIDALNDI